MDCYIFKFFWITTRPRKGSFTIEVIWQMPYVNWVKVNINSVTKGCQIYIVCDGIFRGILY